MAIEFLIDENMPMAVSRAVLRHNKKGANLIQAVQVGQQEAPEKGTLDPPLLRWIEEHSRILISYDKKTLPDHFAAHLVAGRHVPGIFLFKTTHSLAFIVEFLALVTHASEPEEWRDRLFYVD